MALFNYANREITAKIVYYGPGVCGKTTSLQYIHERISPAQRGRLLSLATETDRTIFFDLLPLKLGEIGGFKLRFQLYTVPGQVKYNKTRKLVLQGADAVVFVADSQINRREANIVSLQNLRDNLLEQNRRIEDIPLVLEYNKRDMENILSIEDLNKDLNPRKLAYFPAVATKGVGVMETLEAISKIALDDMEQRLKGSAATVSSQIKEQAEDEDEELLKMMEDDSLMDLTEATGGDLSFSSEELDSLELESDLGGETLESKPIGYGNEVEVEELEINEELVAQTGTLKESEFFNLKELEEQALKELDEFLDSKDGGEDSFDFSDFSAGESVEGTEDFSFNADAEEQATATAGASSGWSLGLDSEGAGENDMDFSFSAAVPESPEENEELAFGLENDEEAETFSLDESMENDDLGTLELEEFGVDETVSSESKSAIEPLNLSDSELDFGLGAENETAGEELPAFTLDEGDERGESTSFALEDDFGALDSEGLNFGEPEESDSVEKMFMSENIPEPPDFRITDSVRFEMQVGEDISTVTPFEQQLDRLSGDMFKEEDESYKEEFQPEVSEATEEEQFQEISDEWTRLIVVAKHLFYRGEQLRAQHTTSENVAAILMYYAAIETALKTVASKYETCNPSIAAFHLILESIEEETQKQVAGAKSIMNNIVMMKNRIQLEAGYPDDEECELAARISERFLVSLSQDFLTIDFNKLSPVLARSEGN
ncbi:GTPase-like protein [Candidatus Moduliflexus flocculans]|uniref:GTPase-like protein n=1 Tax=Candidatus Moduliflexus flocculans TaxID=1499966 RepID=A0A081BTC8_9BACT|nr:GTPase-like protein [Candidatus Moduliflexus flocculans]